MNPRLIAISGSLKGTIFDLAEDEILIGREVSNSICLNDLSVSRRHCLIKRERAQTPDKIAEAKPQAGEVNSESGRLDHDGQAINLAGASNGESGQPERDGRAATLASATAVPA